MQFKRFTVGLSFRDTDRRFVRNVAKRLADLLGKDKIFFDEWLSPEIRGTGGDDKLRKIYRDDCELLVPFFSAGYEDNWCGVEWHSIKASMMERPDDDHVVPVHLDGTKIEGWERNDIGIRRKKLPGHKVADEIYEICKKRCPSLQSSNIATANHPTSLANDSLAGLGINPNEKTTIPDNSVDDEAAPDHGFLIVIDVADSSALPGRKLREVIKSLWMLPDDLSPEKLGNGAAASGILDGLILAIPRARHERVLCACCSIIKRLHAEHDVLVRIAVHRGDYHRVQNPSLIVGTAPNESSRMVRIAGPGQIVVSEAFVHSWVNDEGKLPPRSLFPELHEPPWQIQQKPGTASTLRLYVCPSQEIDLLPQSQPPEPLQWIHQAEQGIRNVLKVIEHHFCLLVAEFDDSLRPGTLKPRVSVFAPDRSSGYLLPTEFRFVRHGFDQSLAKVGNTKYGIGSMQLAIGPLGQAFAQNTVQIIADLPEYQRDPGAYFARLAAKPWSLPNEVVKQFGRKARAYLAIPFSLTGTDTPPEGVICIDTEHPLSGIPPDEVMNIGVAIELNYRIVLAALWRLRI